MRSFVRRSFVRRVPCWARLALYAAMLLTAVGHVPEEAGGGCGGGDQNKLDAHLPPSITLREALARASVGAEEVEEICAVGLKSTEQLCGLTLEKVRAMSGLRAAARSTLVYLATLPSEDRVKLTLPASIRSHSLFVSAAIAAGRLAIDLLASVLEVAAGSRRLSGVYRSLADTVLPKNQALLVAVRWNDTQLLRSALRRGANPNLQPPQSFLASLFPVLRGVFLRQPPLCLACECGHAQIAQVLLEEAGAHPDIKNSRNVTALMLATGGPCNDIPFAERGGKTVKRFFLHCLEKYYLSESTLPRLRAALRRRRASSPAENNITQLIALHNGCEYEVCDASQQDLIEQVSIVAQLIKAGADPNARGRLGHTALFEATRYRKKIKNKKNVRGRLVHTALFEVTWYRSN